MVMTSKCVKKNKVTGAMSFIVGPTLDMVINRLTPGWSETDKWVIAATAEIALEHGYSDMAKAWAVYHKCPVDCTLNLCSSSDCPRVIVKPKKKIVHEKIRPPKPKKSPAKKSSTKKRTRKIKEDK